MLTSHLLVCGSLAPRKTGAGVDERGRALFLFFLFGVAFCFDRPRVLCDEFDLKEKENTNPKEDKKYAFGDQERENIRSAIYGSIYNADVETTHPLALGYDKNYFTLKTSASAYELNKGVNTVASLAKDIQPMAGFSGELAIKQQSESLLIGVESFGRGSVVYMVDNPLYRSFWENGKLWLVNAIFY